MNKTEFAALPPDLQRDVKCAVACGWPLKKLKHLPRVGGIYVEDNFLTRLVLLRAWNPTTDRTIWAGLLEAFPMHIAPNVSTQQWCVWTRGSQSVLNNHLPTAIVCEVIRRDPLGHLGRAGL